MRVLRPYVHLVPEDLAAHIEIAPRHKPELWKMAIDQADYLRSRLPLVLAGLLASASTRRFAAWCRFAASKRCSQEIGYSSFKPWSVITAYSGRLSMTILRLFPLFSTKDALI